MEPTFFAYMLGNGVWPRGIMHALTAREVHEQWHDDLQDMRDMGMACRYTMVDFWRR